MARQGVQTSSLRPGRSPETSASLSSRPSSGDHGCSLDIVRLQPCDQLYLSLVLACVPWDLRPHVTPWRSLPGTGPPVLR